MVRVTTGVGEVGEGGVIIIWAGNIRRCSAPCEHGHFTEALKREREIVNCTGRRANDGMG